jgi:hypothetical protein
VVSPEPEARRVLSGLSETERIASEWPEALQKKVGKTTFLRGNTARYAPHPKNGLGLINKGKNSFITNFLLLYSLQ